MMVGGRLDRPPANWLSRFFTPRVEESPRLRVLTLVSLWLACLGLAWVGGDLRLSLFGGSLGSLGYWLGWRWRHQRSLARSLLIVSAVIAVSVYMRSQMMDVFNSNWLPVGHFIVLVQAAASFESRTRGGLYAGLVLSGTVLFFASQQAFQATFGIFVVGFVVVLPGFLTLTFLEDGIRDAKVHWTHHRPVRSSMLPYWLGVACTVFILSGLAFWLMPKGQIGLSGPTELTVLPYSGQSFEQKFVQLESIPKKLGSFSNAEDVAALATDGITQVIDDQDLDQRQLVFQSQEETNPQAIGSGSATLNEGHSGLGSFAFGTVQGMASLQASNETVLFVRTKVTGYWLGRTLERFDGRSWSAQPDNRTLFPSSNQDGVWYVRDNLNRGFRNFYQQTFYLQQDSPETIYTGYQAVRISTLAGSVNGNGGQRNSSYRVLSAYPEHSTERLRQDKTWVASPRLIFTPPDSRHVLSILSGQITDGAASDFERVERIVGYLRQERTFVPGWPKTLTTSANLDEFLIDGQPGDAMDYATATVMLARASGLPARIAVGYLPGVRDPLSGAYQVRLNDAHAWAEIYFADHGWVPFDSSPRGNIASVGASVAKTGYFFNAGVGDAVVGAVKSAPAQLVDVALDLNQSQSGIYMDGGINTGLSGSEELLCPSLQDSPAPLLDLFPPRGQLGEVVTQCFLHRGSGAQAQVRGGLFPCPVPDRLGSIEIRTVSRQAHQSQAQAGGSQVGTQGVTMMDWSVVPDDVQWSGVLIPQLLQEGSGGLGVAVPLQFHNLHLAGLQAHRRIIAGLFAPPGAARIYQRRLSLEHPFPPQVRIRSEMGLISEEDLCPHLLCLGQQRGIRRHEGFPLGFVGLKEMLLWPLQDKTQAVEVVQATAAGQRVPEAFLDKSPHHFPVPIRQVDACLFGQRLDRSLQLGLPVSVEDGGEPPDCSKARAVGPPVPKAVTHMPMVWESRSSASATADAVQPKAKSQSACHRSRSRGVDARYMRLRTSPTSSCHRSRSCAMSLIPNTTATLLPLQTNAAPFQV